jgi:hypothetical protein
MVTKNFFRARLFDIEVLCEIATRDLYDPDARVDVVVDQIDGPVGVRLATVCVRDLTNIVPEIVRE